MDGAKEIGFFVLTGLIGMLGYFLRVLKDETDKKISTLFDLMNLQREQVAHLRERLARLEK